MKRLLEIVCWSILIFEGFEHLRTTAAAGIHGPLRHGSVPLDQHLRSPQRQLKNATKVADTHKPGNGTIHKSPADASADNNSPQLRGGSDSNTSPTPGSQGGKEPGRKLEIVIAHFDHWNLDNVREFWLSFVDIPAVKKLEPYLFIYCQNNDLVEEKVREGMGRLTDRGEVVKLDNKGREGRVYLYHIVHNYERLPRHTLFSQDVVGEHWIPDPPFTRRVENLFTPETGVLALAEMWMEGCNDHKWIDNPGQETHVMYETYSLVTGKYCPPSGFLSFYKGQFIVSRARIQGRPKQLYSQLLEMLEAGKDHWIHGRHNAGHFKDPSGPYLGHVYERSWTLLFDCYKGGQEFIDRCNKCDEKRSQGCNQGDCQCRDEEEESQHATTISIDVKHKGPKT